MKKVILLLLVWIFNFSHAEKLSELYPFAVKAQSTNSYQDFLKDFAANRDVENFLLEKLVSRLEKLKRMGQSSRQQELFKILYYFSDRREAYKARAVNVLYGSTYSEQDLLQGNYDSEILAREFLKAIQFYETNVTLPLLLQIEKEMVSDFNGQIVFSIGRDFSIVQQFLLERKSFSKNQLVTLNVSRAIKNLVAEGQHEALKQITENIGLTKEALLKKGIVFLDSSMSGKIPKALFYALSMGMSDQETREFAKKVDIRYVKARSSKSEDLNFSDFLLSCFNEKGQFDREKLKTSINQTGLAIKTFKLSLPKEAADYDINHIHNLLEHRPKFVNSANGFSEDKGQAIIASKNPDGVGGQINALLGLYAEYMMLSLAKDGKFQSNVKEIDQWFTEKPALFSQLDKVVKKDQLAGLLNFATTSLAIETTQFHKTINVVEAKSREFPFELWVGKERWFRLRGMLGQGKNVSVYLTEENTALKVMIRPENSYKALIQSWIQNKLEDQGIRTAKILRTHRTGVLQEQEYVPGYSLEYLQYHDPKKVSDKIRDSIYKQWAAAKKLTAEGLWLDFRSGNFQLNAAGEPVMVDFVPRTNPGYWRYFLESRSGSFLMKNDFWELFFNYHVQKGNIPQAPNVCAKFLKE